MTPLLVLSIIFTLFIIAAVVIIARLARNISERKRAENEKEDMLTQLVQSEKISAIEELGGSIAHQLNNPLAAILGTTQLLLMSAEKNSTIYEDLKNIESLINRCRQITQTLLVYPYKKELEFKPVKINETLDKAALFVKNQMGARGISIVRQYNINVPDVKGDDFQLEQVFVNLMLNAWESMPKGGTLTIETGSEGGNIKIRFIDTGKGIAKENITNLFDPFFVNRDGDYGIGLGLYMCARMIEKHKGNIQVQSDEGKGSKFIIELPVN